MWTIKPEDEVGRRLKKFQKKWPHELRNVFDNLDTLLDALQNGAKTEQLKALGFVQSEPQGILAVNQKGPGKGAKLKPFRLYVFADERAQMLHAIILGDKDSQGDDLRLSTLFVKSLTRDTALGGAKDAAAG